jgi:ubiquinone/menaquinone biosynthesis C-methylase UbiE/TusA-related sulfurtransferase
MSITVDKEALETKVKDMYRHVAEDPHGQFHFELGEQVALRAGYEPDHLKTVPADAVESFAGVGYFFDLAGLSAGETVVDLGSGSGMDAFYAAGLVGPTGRVVGVDFTLEQLEKARRIAASAGLEHVDFIEGRIESLPIPTASADCVISNGVINLAPDKAAVFAEAARILRPGGRLAIADIISERPLTDAIVCNADLWASCIGGAAQQDLYLDAIESSGFVVDQVRDNAYEFISDQARNASARYGVKSISVLATKQTSIAGAAGESSARRPSVRPHVAGGQAVTSPHHTLDAPGMACIDLTPLIARAMRDLQPGEVLEVHTDDPAARVGVPAWCRLTGNRLVHTGDSHRHAGQATTWTTFHIAKKAS